MGGWVGWVGSIDGELVMVDKLINGFLHVYLACAGAALIITPFAFMHFIIKFW